MDNKYVYMILAGVFGMVWYHVGGQSYFSADGQLSEGYNLEALIAVALGAGSNSGTDAIYVLKDGIAGYIPTAIVVAVFAGVANISYQLITTSTVDPMAAVTMIVTFVASAVLANVFLGYLKKSL